MGWTLNPRMNQSIHETHHAPARRRVRWRRYLVFAAVALWLLLTLGARAAEVLYNGIELPEEWPPKVDWEDIKTRKPILPPPCLKQPPSVIPIDVGRQLFVDNFLIAETTLKTIYHPRSVMKVCCWACSRSGAANPARARSRTRSVSGSAGMDSIGAGRTGGRSVRCPRRREPGITPMCNRRGAAVW